MYDTTNIVTDDVSKQKLLETKGMDSNDDKSKRKCAMLLNVFLHICHQILVKEAINIISEKIGNDWKKLACKLGLEKTDIDAIMFENPSNLRECIHGLFSHWQQKEGSRVSIQKLVNGLLDAQLGDIANEVSTKLLGTIAV